MTRIVALTIAVVAIAWSLAILRTCWFAGDYMIGFAPSILFALPVATFVLTAGLASAVSRKSKLTAACSIIGFALIVTTVCNMHRITRFAWQKSLETYSKTNQSALQNTDFSTAQLTDADFPDARKMIPIDGFEWYCDHHLAAPNGDFRGFAYHCIHHVYVNKVRHGFRGIAWVPSPEMIPPSSGFEYSYSGVDNWYTWKYGG